MKTRIELEALPVNGAGGLKELARQAETAKGNSTTWVATGSKAALIDCIVGSVKERGEALEVETKAEVLEPEGKSIPPVKVETEVQSPAMGLGILETAIGSIVDSRVKAIQARMESKLQAMTAEIAEAKGNKPSPIVVRIASKDGSEKDKEMGVQHRMFPLFLSFLASGANVALVGGAGSGKTSAAVKAAEGLGKDFRCQSFCRMTTKSDLLGFMSASGDYVGTAFRESFEKGMIFVADEFDAGNDNASLVLNSSLANHHCLFADRQVDRHEGFQFVACLNTFGRGADRSYVGRSALDAATLDRLVFVPWDVDEALEASLVGVAVPQVPVDIAQGGIETNAAAWVARVQALRKGAEKAGVRHVISPRATVGAVAASANGVGRHWIEECVIWKGLDTEQRNRVEAASK